MAAQVTWQLAEATTATKPILDVSDAAFGAPARSLSTYDPSQYDAFIHFIVRLLHHSFVLADSFSSTARGTMQQLDVLVREHIASPASSKLRRLVPSIGSMHTPLAFLEAWESYDTKYHLTARVHVPPSADEVRHILNLAQVFGSSADLAFISFDGDETLYADGRNFAPSDATKLARWVAPRHRPSPSLTMPLHPSPAASSLAIP